ncbi:hypothetical protein BDB00DRAFT_834025, partial [Zychaea mexicana]|uniref:uncharacterized protein n=1 Tax=Zychaea mexicana TaxID=64656 RepID=UPI0022FDD786
MNEPTLVWDVIYQILDECISLELAESRQLLDQSTKKTCWSSQLILINRQCRNYILQNALFHRLQVFYSLGRTTRWRDPVIVGVDKGNNSNEWTMLHVSLVEDRQVEMFSLLEVRPPRQSAPSLLLDKKPTRSWNRHDTSRVVLSGDGRVVPLFCYDRMVKDIEEFATLNSASIWVWRSPSNAWLYRHRPTYKLYLDYPENELLIWELGKSALHNNVPVFASLAQPGAATQMLL